MRNAFSTKINREHIAQKYGLTDSCEIVRVFLTSTQKEELMNHVFFTDAKTYTSVAKSPFFFLIQDNNSNFELFCSEQPPQIPMCIEMLNDKRFIHVQVDEKYLLKFLSIITPLRVVELNEA